jgi:hypothetical protein
MADLLYVEPAKEYMTDAEVADRLYEAFKDHRGATLAGDEALMAYERHMQQKMQDPHPGDVIDKEYAWRKGGLGWTGDRRLWREGVEFGKQLAGKG